MKLDHHTEEEEVIDGIYVLICDVIEDYLGLCNQSCSRDLICM